MYYASDGSANAGGIINITNFTESASDNKLLIETNTDISGKLVVNDDLSVNGSIFFSNNLYQNGELFSGSNTSDASFNVIQEFMDGSRITFLSDVSFNTRLIASDASFNNIGAIDGSLIIVGDLSVNGQIFTSGGLVGAGGGSGTDGSFNVIEEFTPGEGITFLSDVSFNRIGGKDGSLVIMGDLSVNGRIFSNTDSIDTSRITIIDNSYATSVTSMNITTPVPWTRAKTVQFKKGSVLLHTIKTSGFISSATEFNWPLGGHTWFLRRGVDINSLTWNSGSDTSYVLRQTFNTILDHEEKHYSFTEEIDADVTYNNWQVDFSGSGAANNIDDKVNWDITFLNGSVQTTAGGGGGGEVTGLSFNNSTRKIEITQSSGTTPLDATIPQNEVTGMSFNSGSGVLTLNQDSGVSVTASGFPTGSGGGTNTFVVNNDLSSEVVNKIKKLEKIVNDLTLEKKTKPEKKILFGKDRILKKKYLYK
jgi:hypothetical protein